MKKLYMILMATTVVVAGAAQADTLTVVTPDDLANQANFPTSPYGWDWDQGAPQGSTTVGGAPGFGTSSWYSNVQGSAANVVGDRDYTTLRLNIGVMFGDAVTMGDLDAISYWTNLQSGTVDWQLKIYTAENSPGVGSSWYGHRFNFNTPNFAAGSGWNQSSTSSNLNVNWVTDGATSNFSSQTLATVASNFASETILFIDIIAGYATNSPAVYSYLDGVAITVDGVTHSLDLAVVPVPAAAPLGLLGMGLVAFVRRRKNAKAQA